MTGLPGTGKTTIAGIAARQLRATLLTVDTIEASLWRAGISREEPTGLAAYVVAQATAEGSLRAGISVVADAVNSVCEAREAWRKTAEQTQSVLRVLEVVCSDPNEHRRRIRSRSPDPARPSAGSWQQVLARPFEPWNVPEPRLVLDTSRMSQQDCRRALQSYLPTHQA
jgi:predicted kinase